jgi:hypothetical protein
MIRAGKGRGAIGILVLGIPLAVLAPRDAFAQG